LKTIEDATTIRRRILAAFEHAERATDEAERAKFLTFVVIGGNPTGVELAGTIAERARDTLRSDFRNFDTRKARVVLVEAGPRLLPGSRESLSAYARKALTNLGVDVTLGRPVTKCMANGVEIDRPVPSGKDNSLGRGRRSVASGRLAPRTGRPCDASLCPDLTVPGVMISLAMGSDCS
jgi:NADH dehydrogenase